MGQHINVLIFTLLEDWRKLKKAVHKKKSVSSRVRAIENSPLLKLILTCHSILTELQSKCFLLTIQVITSKKQQLTDEIVNNIFQEIK